jgi:hypothetical protein
MVRIKACAELILFGWNELANKSASSGAACIFRNDCQESGLDSAAYYTTGQ